jgi:hypothetical protein
VAGCKWFGRREAAATQRSRVPRRLPVQSCTNLGRCCEYCDTTSDGFSYSWFCERYKEWAGRLKPTLRQIHVAGEKLFVDYSGHTMEVIDGLTGEVLTAQIFVAVLGASNFTYAEATFRRRAISRVGRSAENFKRMISRAWRIATLSAGIDRSHGFPKERP